MKPTEPKQILVATDFSPCSQPAMDYAVLLARRFGASLHLLYAAQPPTFVAPEAISVMDEALGAEVTSGQKQIDEQLVRLARLELAGCSGEVQIGFAADVLSSVANSGRYDLVVLGTHGRGGLKHLVLGSVAEQVVRRSLIPVVTVRPQPAAK